ncbi:uncharacterized protein [Parasteatoda tepidariorum]|uniref:uncharacterized protein isoform X1 n=1 Tax=Parasteatoda tepidariorum TaxID=114398 RepID=UPI001C721384|nr:uncharacterized protein LOC122270662 [Parasteatoda tepidariorum]
MDRPRHWQSFCEDQFLNGPFEEIRKPLTEILIKTLNKEFTVTKTSPTVKLRRAIQLQELACATEIKRTAIHEAGHALCIWFWGSKNVVKSSTITGVNLKYFSAPGLTTYKKYDPETLDDYFEELGVCLAGCIAETMFFPDSKFFTKNSNYYLPGDDMHDALNIAHSMAKQKGTMENKAKVDRETLENVSIYLQKGYKAASYLLKTKEKMLIRIAQELTIKSTLRTKDFLTLLGPPKSRRFSLYDRFCGFSIVLRSRERKEPKNMDAAQSLARYQETNKRKAKSMDLMTKKKSKPLLVSLRI